MELVDTLISIVLSLVMFSIGSSLSFKDFNEAFGSKSYYYGLFMQMVFLPLLTFFVVSIADISPEFKIGLFIVSICPGGATSNFISYLVNAKTALSVALTATNSVLILATIPLLSEFVFHYFAGASTTVTLSVFDTFVNVFSVIIIPALIGILFNRWQPSMASSIQRPLKVLNVILLAGVFAIKFFAKADAGGTGITSDDILTLLPYCIFLHFCAMLFSYFTAKKLLKLENDSALTIGIEVGLQNTTLALLVTSTIIGDVVMSKPALVFAIFSFFTTTAFALLASSKKIRF